VAVNARIIPRAGFRDPILMMFPPLEPTDYRSLRS
jgi:hypothetical protein